MDIAIVDADLFNKGRHRFPNLASMKISGFYKNRGHNTELIIDYEELRNTIFDKVFISKVFTDTVVPEWVMNLPNVECGGTGFFYDVSPPRRPD